MIDKLTERQHNFVINYVKNGCNVYQAALSAGYSETFARAKANTLMLHPIISARVSQAYRVVEQQQMGKLCMTISDKAKVLDRIIRAIVPQDETQPVNLKYASEAIKAISELNKMQGDYAPDRRLSITVDATKERLTEARKQYDDY